MRGKPVRELVVRSGRGDVDAFAEIVRRYQDAAFGYAYSVLRDFHLAQDVTQEAFVAAYFGLDRLSDPARFPSWLRGIVRHECGRVLRARRHLTVPLEDDVPVAEPSPGPEQLALERDAADAVLSRVSSLPRDLREVTILHYFGQRSHREIAAFLDLPATTVNNRLHAARQKLREELLEMAREQYGRRGLPEDFPQRVGRVVRARGAVVDAQFEREEVPEILTRLAVVTGEGRPGPALEVVQLLGGGAVRAAMSSPEGQLAPGESVADTGAPAGTSLAPEALRQVVEALSPAATPPRLVETGIKALDLLCPLPDGGRVAFFGYPGEGRMVLVGELVHRLRGLSSPLSIVLPVAPGSEVAVVRESFASGEVPVYSDLVQAIYTPASAQPLELASLFDAVVVFSRDLAKAGAYPAVDTLRSGSRLLAPEVVGEEHCRVAREVRSLLWRAAEIESRVFERERLTEEEQLVVARARRARSFLSQPLFVAEPFTGRPGESVGREGTVTAFREILEGRYDDVPAESLYMCGGIEQVER